MFLGILTLTVVGFLLGPNYSFLTVAILQVFLGIILTFVLVMPLLHKVGLVRLEGLETTHLITIALSSAFAVFLGIGLLQVNIYPWFHLLGEVMGAFGVIWFGGYYLWLVFRSLRGLRTLAHVERPRRSKPRGFTASARLRAASLARKGHVRTRR